MKHLKNNRFIHCIFRWLLPQTNPVDIPKNIPRFFEFFYDMFRYSKIKESEKINFLDTYPCIHDKVETTPFDPHYFYQDTWAFQKIYDSNIEHHVDVGSTYTLIGFLTGIVKVTFIDIRPLKANLENLESKKGNILNMPYENNSVNSLSCLHVAEHIGLGRYGDPLDSLGTKKAAKELSRILAPDGNLYFSLPIGKPKLQSNAHRIHSSKQILDYFEDLTLIEFSGIDDQANFHRNIDVSALNECNYGCGLFWFTKK